MSGRQPETQPAEDDVARWFARLGVAFSVFVVYCSVLPCTPQAVPWADAVDAFRHLPWLELSVYHRADWLANMLVVAPIGFLLSGAIDWGKERPGRLYSALPLITFAIVVLVAVIEFVQIWFPPRTRSINDLLAGVLGAFTGPLLWLLLGRTLTSALLALRYERDSRVRLRWGAYLFAAASVVHAMLPLDVMISAEEWNLKSRAGRLILFPPFADLLSGETIRSASLAAGRVFVASSLFARLGGPNVGFRIGLLCGLLCELIKIPIFTRTASSLDAVACVMGAWLAVAAYKRRNMLEEYLANPARWLWGGVTLLVSIVAVTLVRAEGLINDPELLGVRWHAFLDWPFAKYYHGSEFEAGSNLLAKVLAFALVGYCLHAGRGASPKCEWVAWTTVFLASISIEVCQVYLRGQYADAGDVAIYLCGAASGYLFYWFIHPTYSESQTSPG